MDAITGLGIVMMFLKNGLKPLVRASFEPSQLDSLSVKSAPAEKPLPAPVIIRTFIASSSFTSEVAFWSSHIKSSLKAFNLSGLLSLIVATLSFLINSRVLKFMLFFQDL